jgi:hypothetical protein
MLDETLLKNVSKLSSVRAMALNLMLVGILLPTAFYSFRLSQSSPTPADLLVAVCMALFSSVLFLWIMDAINILQFRAAWISKSVYGAAIVSVLGTSVGVYKDYFNARKYPYEGAWQVVLSSNADSMHPTEFPVVLTYSESGGKYWGYSNLISKSQESALWAEVTEFVPEEKTLELRLSFANGEQRVFKWLLTVSRKGRFFKSDKENSNLSVELRRPG